MFDGYEGIVEAVLLNLADHEGDIHMSGADIGAGGEAIAGVVCEEEFEGGAACFCDFGGFGLDVHSVEGPCGAGGDESGRAVDFDDAAEAGGIGAASVA